MWASYKGHEDVVALLLEKGADVHAHGNYNIKYVWLINIFTTETLNNRKYVIVTKLYDRN